MATNLGTIDRAHELLGEAEQLELSADPKKITLLIAKSQAHATIALVRQLDEIAYQLGELRRGLSSQGSE